ncbi:MAG: inositol monophosphatase family protein [Bacteroidota bacterium]|nr:inositol monophosphatase family protein [Bacteroidota bacterium]
MDSIIHFAHSITREAGKLLAERFGHPQEVDFKGDIDMVTETDRLSERLLMEKISSAFPDHGILSEESPAVKGNSEWRWVIDPLDGTTNYAHGFPFFCVSIALEKQGSLVWGAVFDPLRDEMFEAALGAGARLNGSPIRVSKVDRLADAFLATGFPYDIRVNPDNNLDHFSAMATRSLAIRRAGSAALDLAYTAAGRFDGFWELKLKPWDTAAGTLIVSEAGGCVTDLDGSDHHLESPAVVASNGLIHGEMLAVLGESVKK